MVNLLGRRDGGSEVDYTVNPGLGFPILTGPADSPVPANHVFPAWDAIAGNMIATAAIQDRLVLYPAPGAVATIRFDANIIPAELVTTPLVPSDVP